jgi:hypothetical protein
MDETMRLLMLGYPLPHGPGDDEDDEELEDRT